MAAWNSRGLRGSTLEDYINMTNEKYLANHLGLIQKIPPPNTYPHEQRNKTDNACVFWAEEYC